MTTPRPWTVVDHTDDRKGYMRIEGPNGQKVCDIFPFVGEGGVGVEEARKNAVLIVTLANARELG